MVKVRRSLTALLVAVLTLSLVLVGCSSNNGGNNNGDTSAPATTEATDNGGNANAEDNGGKQASDLAPYDLKIVFAGTTQKDEKKVEEAINAYLKDKINATVDIQMIDYGPWEQKINLMLGSNDPTDIYFTASWNGYAQNVAKKAYLPLEDLLKEYGKGITDSLDPAFLAGSKIGGKNYGVPTNKELAAQGGFLYRSDIADELKLDLSNIKTYADLEKVLEQVKAAKPEMTPLYVRQGENLAAHYMAQLDYMGDANAPGVVLKDQDSTTIVPTYELDRYKEYLNFAREFYVKGLVNQDASTTQVSNADALKSGKYFMTPASLKPGKDAEIANQIGMQGKIKQITFTDKTVSTGETTGAMLAISQSSKDPARAMMFINLLHTDKYLNNLINFGIENAQYTKVSDNIIKAAANQADYNPGAAWQLGNQFLNYVWDTEAPDKWEQFKEFNTNVKSSPALGFTFDATPVKNQMAAVKTAIDQYRTALETGAVDPQKVLPEYISQMEKTGAKDIIAEKQKQLDAFLASN